MDDVIVSIRIPEPLLNEVKDIIKDGHYLDLSEGIRSIIRDSWLNFTQPEIKQLKNIRNDIKKGLETNTEKMVIREVIEELNKIKKLVKEDNLR